MSVCPRCQRDIPILAGPAGVLAKHRMVEEFGRDRCPGSAVTPADAAAGITSVDRQVEDHYVRLADRHHRGLTPAERADLATRGIVR